MLEYLWLHGRDRHRAAGSYEECFVVGQVNHVGLQNFALAGVEVEARHYHLTRDVVQHIQCAERYSRRVRERIADSRWQIADSG
jgi:hypothetical protein